MKKPALSVCLIALIGLTVPVYAGPELLSGGTHTFLAPSTNGESADVNVIDPPLATDEAGSVVQSAGRSLEMEEALTLAAAEVCNPPAGCSVSDFQRVVVVDDIVHYSALVQVGPGAYDRVRIHRVVREQRPGHPIKAVDRVMLQHGDAKNFVGMFLPGTLDSGTPDDFGFAVFLARQKVDVWGIDQSWTLVPAQTADFSFMQDWGLQHAVDDLSRALAIARRTRVLGGASGDRFNLLGYSSGVTSGYALLNQEAAMPRAQRQVQGFICADNSYIYTDPDALAVVTGDLALQRHLYAQGDFGSFVPFQLLGTLAATDPDGDSPLLPGLTNREAALFFGSAALFGNTPIHYFAGVFDANGLPVALQYVPTDAFINFLETAIVWQPTKWFLDVDEVQLGIDTPFDDNLSLVSVPIFNWGAGGGLGPYGSVMRSLVGSRDFSEYLVRLHPAEEILLEFAHIDLFIAKNAPEVAWQPVLDWLHDHR